MAVFGCCKLRSLVLGIAVVFFCCQAALLVATLVLAASDVGAAVGRTVDFLEANANEDRDFQAAREFREVRPSLVRRSYDFLAIPVTACIVLMLSDALLAWSAASKQHKILLWPWLVLHAVEWAAALAALVFLILVVPKTFMKVLLFLVVSPFLVVFAFCWFVVKCFFNYLRDLSHKEAVAAVYTNYESKQYPLPATVYSTSDSSHHLWDQPLPIWASAAVSNGGPPGSLPPPPPSLGPVPPPAQPMLGPPGWEHHYLPPITSDYGNPASLPPFSNGGAPAYYHSQRSQGPRSVGSGRSRRSRLNPTRLPDGTLVVPLADEDDRRDLEDEDEEDLPEIEEETEDEERGGRGGGGGGGARRSKAGSGVSGAIGRRRRRRRSAGRQQGGGGGGGGGGAGSRPQYFFGGNGHYGGGVYGRRTRSAAAMSDDGTTASVVSLSDKYRQQEELEIFEEFYPVPLPPPASKSRDNSQQVSPNDAASAAAAAIPIHSTRAAAAAGRRSREEEAAFPPAAGDSPKTQSTVTA